ncbi:MAG: ParA family protein [Limnohabitans sp.]|jgi:cellulose biosynthesis protein BcsQ|nr:ParA family protein [Limnohabitans sp.]
MAFKILVTSQKGGVGKSTLSANLVAYLSRTLGLGVTLIDWDPHGSSSTWLNQAPNVGAVVQHLSLPVDQGGNRPIFEARLQMRRAASECDILVCDLTWSDSLAGELMFEFDMVLVPTSVSEIELAATSGFLSRNRWVFDSATARRPMLVVCPTRVLNEQLNSDVFTKQRFPVSFMLAPPILEAQSARDLFERGYLMDARDMGGESFREFGEAICAAREIRMAQANQPRQPVPVKLTERDSSSHRVPLTPSKSSVLDTVSSGSQFSVLGRYRQRKIAEDNEAVVNSRSLAQMGIPEFLKRLARGSSAKL